MCLTKGGTLTSARLRAKSEEQRACWIANAKIKISKETEHKTRIKGAGIYDALYPLTLDQLLLNSLFLVKPARPIKHAPKKSIVAGSGTFCAPEDANAKLDAHRNTSTILDHINVFFTWFSLVPVMDYSLARQLVLQPVHLHLPPWFASAPLIGRWTLAGVPSFGTKKRGENPKVESGSECAKSTKPMKLLKTLTLSKAHNRWIVERSIG